MRIHSGNKRYVILIRSHAIKIGKIRLIRSISRLILLPFSRKLRNRFVKKYGSNFWTAFRNDLFAGLLCNRHEYNYFAKSKDQRVMPTLCFLLGGHIIIQMRGSPASHDDVMKEHPLYKSAPYKSANLDAPEQYCVHTDGKLRIVDYGDSVTTSFLKEVGV